MNWITSLLGNLNYGTIWLLMLLESTVIPVPSELVVSPAAYHAAGGNLNIWLVILFATIGADCGATINYLAGYYMVATITGRLIPGIRHLISIPAGLSKMKYWQFLLYTTLGAGAWNCILAALGWYLHTVVPENQLQAEIERYGEYIKFVIIGLVIIGLLYLLFKRMRKSKKGKAQ